MVRLDEVREHPGDRHLVQRAAVCGPFRSADDFDSGKQPPQDFCDLAVFLNHPEAEHAEYPIDVTYLGAAAGRIISLFTVCTGTRGWPRRCPHLPEVETVIQHRSRRCGVSGGRQRPAWNAGTGPRACP